MLKKKKKPVERGQNGACLKIYGEKEISMTKWPASLAQTLSSRFSETPCLKYKAEN